MRFFDRLRRRKRLVLICMRLDEMQLVHPEQIEMPCAKCGEMIGVYPSGQAVMRSQPILAVCNHCAPSEPAIWRPVHSRSPFKRGVRWRAASAAAKPIPMLLWCPSCGERHLDVGEFATKEHHTHACQGCGMVWRPAIVPTVGVQFLPGFKNLSETLPDDTEPSARGGSDDERDDRAVRRPAGNVRPGMSEPIFLVIAAQPGRPAEGALTEWLINVKHAKPAA